MCWTSHTLSHSVAPCLLSELQAKTAQITLIRLRSLAVPGFNQSHCTLRERRREGGDTADPQALLSLFGNLLHPTLEATVFAWDQRESGGFKVDGEAVEN